MTPTDDKKETPQEQRRRALRESREQIDSSEETLKEHGGTEEGPDAGPDAARWTPPPENRRYRSDSKADEPRVGHRHAGSRNSGLDSLM